jgi:hypothetical protein
VDFLAPETFSLLTRKMTSYGIKWHLNPSNKYELEATNSNKVKFEDARSMKRSFNASNTRQMLIATLIEVSFILCFFSMVENIKLGSFPQNHWIIYLVV